MNNNYSVLMTVYKDDGADAFKLSLKSMLFQTVKPKEIIIVKDGKVSKEVQEIIDEFKQDFEGDIDIIPVQLKNNVGLALALNEGFKYINNELVARMDSDDYSLPNRCELQLKQFEIDPELDIVGCCVDEFVDDIDNIVGSRNVPYNNKDIYKFAKLRDPFNHPTVMYKKSSVQSVGYYSNYRKNQDTDLWIKMLNNGAKCCNITERVFRFRFDKNTFEKRKSWENTKTLIKIRYQSWLNGFNSFFEFFAISILQIAMFLLPTGFQERIYKRMLR